MALPPPLQQLVDFLRAGYPEGVPEHDYQPLLALLGREFAGTDAEETDIARVRDRLESVGWSGSHPRPRP